MLTGGDNSWFFVPFQIFPNIYTANVHGATSILFRFVAKTCSMNNNIRNCKNLGWYKNQELSPPVGIRESLKFA